MNDLNKENARTRRAGQQRPYRNGKKATKHVLKSPDADLKGTFLVAVR